MAIPNSTGNAEVTSTLTGQRGKFSVHEHAHEKIMGVLTNLYEDPEGAVVREYLTNALDAQIEAMKADPNYVWRPIEVTTPSHFNKTYSIRDFGVGMTVEDIEKVYSQYGYSTKEHTNDQTGMLGLGSKCGLTYTGQFTITGYKNGVRVRALITLNEDEVPEYIIMDTSKTDEPNGVEIAVTVRDRNTFEEKTKNFLKWWKPGQVLVNGHEPTPHGAKEVKPGIFLIERDRQGYGYSAPTSYVIMGNVPYAVDPEHVDEDLRNAYLGFAAYVPMGTVDFPPSRERLRYNTRTKAAVAEISNGLFEAILDEKLKEITDAPTFKEAYEKKGTLTGNFASHPRSRSLLYKGHKFPDRIDHAHMLLDWDWQGHGQISERRQMHIAAAIQGTLIVTGVTLGTKPTSYFKKKVKYYMDSNNISGDSAYLTDVDVDSVWLDHLPRIDADTIKALKLPKDPNAVTGPRTETPFDYYTVDAAGIVKYDSAVLVPANAGQTIAYISPQDMKETYRKSGCSATDLAKRLGSDYVLVVTGKNRFEKFLRNHPGAITANKAIQDRIDAYVALTTDAEYIIGQLEHGEKEFLKAANLADIKDDDLVAIGKLVQSKNVTDNYALASNLHAFARRASAVTRLPEKKNVKSNAVKRYPLINHLGGRQVKHLTIYVNAVYEQEYAPKP